MSPFHRGQDPLKGSRAAAGPVRRDALGVQLNGLVGPTTLYKVSRSTIFALQRMAGNRAVTSALAVGPSDRQLPPPLVPAQLSIQRVFNPATDNPGALTKDPTHPALVNIGIAKMGPYEFNPMKGTFRYVPPAVPKAPGPPVQHFLLLLRKHKKAVAMYEPETAAAKAKFSWTNPVNNAVKIDFHPGGTTPAPFATRTQVAKAKWTGAQVGYKAGNKTSMRSPGLVVDAMNSVKNVKAGDVPRAFAGIAQEDVLGAAGNAHNQARHVVGGADMPDNDAVAVRAAFGLIGGLGGHPAMYSKTASAFKTVGDADADVAAAINADLIPNWDKHRVDLVINGSVTLKKPRAGGQIVAYQSTGAKWGKAERPQYLDGAAAGQKPLFDPDPRWDAWAGVDPAKLAFKGQPLTTDASANLPNVNVRIVSSGSLKTKGWFINSAYPYK